MKVAIGTDDRITIREGYFGDSRYFRIVEFRNAEIVGRQWRANPFSGEDLTRRCQEQTDAVLSLLEDCSLFMARRISTETVATFRAHGIDCILSPIADMDQALVEYVYESNPGFRYFSSRTRAFAPCSERNLISGRLD